MLEKFMNKFEYQKLSPEEQEKRGILGRLVGVIADFKNPTRNGRNYSESLWEKVFDDPIMQEKIKNRCVFGELGHPEDRTEINIEKVALCLSEQPKKGNDGKLYGVFDILSTPCGKILKSLCDYGCTIGVSSRGSGDTYTDNNGNEAVDPDSYDCVGWDAVLIPAVKEARMSLVNEGLDTQTLKLQKALSEAVEQASDEDKKVMREALKELNINLVDPSKNGSVNINENLNSEEKDAANDGADITKEFLKILKENKDLVKQVKDLQEKLSVCYTKEAEYGETSANYEDRIKVLEESLKDANEKSASVDSLNEQIRIKNAVIEKLHKNNEQISESKNSLNESVSTKNSEIMRLSTQVKSLSESLKKEQADKESQVKSLTENLEDLRKDANIKRNDFQTKLQKSNELTERYKNIAKMAVDKYISSQAVMLGVDKQEIKSRLHENYSFDDIDKVCENLKTYQLSVDALPFDARNSSKVRLRVTESKNNSIKEAVIGGNTSSLDDSCDEQLLGLAGL